MLYDSTMLVGFLLEHIPELHPESGTTLLEREDEGHVLKVYTCTEIHVLS